LADHDHFGVRNVVNVGVGLQWRPRIPRSRAADRLDRHGQRTLSAVWRHPSLAEDPGHADALPFKLQITIRP
jgi:hypothetical protein